MGRKLEQTPTLLLVVNAAKDLDLKSTEYLYDRLLEYRKEGGTVLLISVDLDGLWICRTAYTSSTEER